MGHKIALGLDHVRPLVACTLTCIHHRPLALGGTSLHAPLGDSVSS